MGEAKTEFVKKELKKLKRIVNKKIRIDKFILFGSRARNEELLTSDVDVIAISDSFKGVNFRKRPLIFLNNWKLPVDLEILCYSKDEIKKRKNEIGIIHEALKTGISI